VRGQGRDFIGDWLADNFVRWAHCLGFIRYEYSDDSFSITKTGLELTAAYSGTTELSEQECTLLINALLSYPPAIRILSLLAPENAHLTKFELGKKLGFIGEGGFTSMPQNILIRSLAVINNIKEKNKMRNDWEGSSDKYARMIARWLIQLGLVQKVSKEITVTVGKIEYTETIGQAYMITAQGLTALNRALGKSRHARINKNICYEMLATKGVDREYLRSRRAYIIKFISESKKSMSIAQISEYLTEKDIKTTESVIHDDIKGFKSIGLDISIDDDNIVIWKDKINDFIIPVRAGVTQSSIEKSKDDLRMSITHIPHDYLSLLDLAYDNRRFH
jgi:hypothetical protein